MSDPHDSNLRRAADLCRDLGRSALAEAVSRAIDRIAELEERLASILDASEDDMPLDRAEELAALWAAGKLIGGDAHAVAITLYAALISERGQREAAEAELAAERERREAAEGILRNIRNRGVGGWVTSAIDDHFARYYKD